MGVVIPYINTAIESFQSLYTKVNLIINAVANGMVSINLASNGAISTGNAFVNGIFGANVLTATTLRGGNIQSNGVLTIYANSITLGNGSVNSFANSTYMNTAFLDVSANNSSGFKANTTSIWLNGKTYTNLDMAVTVSNNSTLIGSRDIINFITTNTGFATLFDNAAANCVDVRINSVIPNDALIANSLTVGNGSVNAYINSTMLIVKNVNSQFTVISGTWTVGNASVFTFANSSQISVSTIVLGNTTNGFTANTSAVRLNNKPYTNLDPNMAVANNGVVVGARRPTINFIASNTANVSVVDNSANDRLDVTLTAYAFPAGAGAQVQFNDGGIFGGSAGLTFSKTQNNLSVANTLLIGANLSIGNVTSGFAANTTAILLNGKSYSNLDPFVIVNLAGNLIGTRPTINFISTNTATATVTDNVANNRVDVSVTALAFPAGIGSQVQYNDGGVFAGSAGFTFSKTTNTISIANTLSIGNATNGFAANTTAILLNGKQYANLDPFIAGLLGGVAVASRPALNFIGTVSAGVTVVDNSANNRLDITLTSNAQPGGSTTQLQYNDGGVFNGSAGLVFAKASNNLTLGNTLFASILNSNSILVGVSNSSVGFSANSSSLTLNGKTYANLDSVISILSAGTLVGNRNSVNFVSGTDTTLAVVDNGASNRVDVSIGINAASLSAGVIGGTNTQIQYNDSGGFNGSTGLLFAKDTYILTVGNTTTTPIANIQTLIMPYGKRDSLFVNSASLTSVVIDSFYLTDFRAAEYLLTIKDNTANAYQVSKIMVIHDGGVATMTEYATLLSNNNLAVFTVSTNASHAILNYTGATSNTSIKAVRQLVAT